MSASMPADMGAAALSALMAEEGPIVSVVVLNVDGTVSEKTVDMSPKANSMVEILGGSASILGQWPQIDVVVLRLRSPGDAASNSHKLQPPMHDEGEQKGTLVCVRMDEESNPQNFTKAEYEEFAKKTFDPADFAPGAADDDDDEDEAEYEVQDDDEDEAEAEEGGSGDDDNEDDEDEEDDEEEDDDEAVGSDEEEAAGIAVLQQIVTQFVEVHGREPSQDELKDVLRQITAAANQVGSDDEEDEEDATGASAAVGGTKRARDGGDDADGSSPNKKPAAEQ